MQLAFCSSKMSHKPVEVTNHGQPTSSVATTRTDTTLGPNYSMTRVLGATTWSQV